MSKIGSLFNSLKAKKSLSDCNWFSPSNLRRETFRPKQIIWENNTYNNCMIDFPIIKTHNLKSQGIFSYRFYQHHVTALKKK